MKIKDFDSFIGMHRRASEAPRRTSRQTPRGMGIGSALLGLACGIGVFAVLTLLYHFG